jgi:hypothetical protein
MPVIRAAKLVTAVILILVFSVGCGVTGNWVLEDVRPPSAKQHFNISRIDFRDDLTFTITATGEDGRQIESNGTYTYSDWTRQLKLRMGAKELDYTAMIWWMSELRLARHLDDGNKMEARFQKAADKPASGSICPTCGQKIP